MSVGLKLDKSVHYIQPGTIMVKIIFFIFCSPKQVVNSDYLIYYPEVHHSHGLITTALGLSLTVEAKHFHEGTMHVKCVGNLSPVLWQGGRESFVQRRPDLLDGREAMLLGKL